MRGTAIDYERILSRQPVSDPSGSVEPVTEVLFSLWRKAYRKMAQSPTCFQEFVCDGYRILLDRPSLLVTRGVLPAERAPEDRVVAACGPSRPPRPRRESPSFLGDVATWLGASDDRSYLRGNVLGTSMDVSLYPLYRDLERERSADGRAYRAMQRYCTEAAGTLCFSRPIYTSRSWSPTIIEHGLLKQSKTFWVRQFHNGAGRSSRAIVTGDMSSGFARSSFFRGR